MRIRRVNRYYCEFCKKANCSKPSIAKHESRCTLNPDRVCGMCHIAEHVQPHIQMLLMALPEPSSMEYPAETGIRSDIMAMRAMTVEEVATLRDAANECPACMLAALRQKGIPAPLADGFDFAKECKEVWNDFNNSRMADARYSHD